ncbi:MAG: efflux RND transporter periplasmic adaptor subunit [Thiohalomonadales bacterium]
MAKKSFGDDDAFWKEFAASNNIGDMDREADHTFDSSKVNTKAGPSIEVDRHAASRLNSGNFGSSMKTTSQFAIALAIAAVPIGFYLFQPGSFSDMFSDVTNVESSLERGRILQEEADRISETLNNIQKNKIEEIATLPVTDTASVPLKSSLTTALTKSPRLIKSISTANKETALTHAAKHADPNYICPMHPSVVTTDPNGICPICGMDVVLVENAGESGLVTLTPTVMNSLGVRTAKVKRRTLYRKIDSVGYINVDENNIRVVTLRTEGWVERLVVKTAGEHVTKGQLLFEIYSPILVNAQDEYVQALRHKNKLLLGASRERLLALGVSKEQIDELKISKKVEHLVKIFAPQSGIIAELNVREGMHVSPSQNIVNLVDLSSVWLLVDVFERQASWVKKGQRAEATLPFMPGRSWEGMVEYIYPSLDATTRSLKVRLRFDNLKEELKPNMYADVSIYAKPKKKVLAIPREALIRTGKEKRVIVALGGGRFMPMSVQVGMETDSKVEILSGLAEGDEVVTSSQFLIDSEASLKASLARLAGGG